MVRFFVSGKPQPKERPRFGKNGKPFTPKKTKSYESRVAYYAAQAMHPLKPIEGAVSMTIRCDIIAPISWSDKKRKSAVDGKIKPTTRPDIDNYLKAVLDGCNGVVYLDDNQVTSVYITKRYVESNAGIEITASYDIEQDFGW